MIIPDPVELHNARKEEGNGLKRPQAGSPSTVMVLHELEQPRETFVLLRGQYNMPDKTQPVTPAVPASLGSQGRDAPKNRLELARWLFESDNPLTARVAVNRLWQQFFGVGLVETSENFGSQGSQPSHPELLDWLSLELIRSGWDLRAIQKLILRSATYQQSSTVTPELSARDPKNRLLARGPRTRLPAFTLRDQALALSGLLVEKIGGPSAKPYMPPKIWSSISNNKYTQDEGENLFRRSLYTYWRTDDSAANDDEFQRSGARGLHRTYRTDQHATASVDLDEQHGVCRIGSVPGGKNDSCLRSRCQRRNRFWVPIGVWTIPERFGGECLIASA